MLNKHHSYDSSHHHIDHVGDPSVFPATTDLIKGPGFKETELPGYPENEDAKILGSDYTGRHLRQLDFDAESLGLVIGGFGAIDYFGDSSFYLLATPGVNATSTRGAEKS